VAPPCRLLASLSQHAVTQLVAAQAMRREQLAQPEGATSQQMDEVIAAKMDAFDPEVQKCKVHERAGRDGQFMPTIPIAIQLKHANRTNNLQLETDFLPLIPRRTLCCTSTRARLWPTGASC